MAELLITTQPYHCKYVIVELFYSYISSTLLKLIQSTTFQTTVGWNFCIPATCSNYLHQYVSSGLRCTWLGRVHTSNPQVRGGIWQTSDPLVMFGLGTCPSPNSISVTFDIIWPDAIKVMLLPSWALPQEQIGQQSASPHS